MSIHKDSDIQVQISQLFTLRFWSEDLGNGQSDWRGKVQHINSGEVIYFRAWPVLEAFINKLLQSASNESGNSLQGLSCTHPEGTKGDE